MVCHGREGGLLFVRKRKYLTAYVFGVLFMPRIPVHSDVIFLFPLLNNTEPYLMTFICHGAVVGYKLEVLFKMVLLFVFKYFYLYGFYFMT